MSINVQFNQFDEGKWKQHQASIEATRVDQDQLKRAFSSNASQSSDDFSFWDFLDIINPLQHIPVVNTIYRELTGDTIKSEANIIGGTLYGGVTGAASAVINEIVRNDSGKDVGGHVMAMAGLDNLGTSLGLKPEPIQMPDNFMVAQADAQTRREDYQLNAQDQQKIAQNAIEQNRSAPDVILEIRAKNYVDHHGNTIKTARPINDTNASIETKTNIADTLEEQNKVHKTDLALIMMQNLEAYQDMKS